MKNKEIRETKGKLIPIQKNPLKDLSSTVKEHIPIDKLITFVDRFDEFPNFEQLAKQCS